jgi:hypothetical protein
MRILIYKRTHKGDPNEDGIFGIQDCMGKIRNWNYDAVIGIGGKSPWKVDYDIKYKINWIGIEPKRIAKTKRGGIFVFAHFELYEEEGKDIKDNFPNLYKYMYDKRKRFDFSNELPHEVYIEVKQILDLIKNSQPSEAYDIEKFEKFDTDSDCDSSKCRGCFDSKEVELTINEC